MSHILWYIAIPLLLAFGVWIYRWSKDFIRKWTEETEEGPVEDLVSIEDDETFYAELTEGQPPLLGSPDLGVILAILGEYEDCDQCQGWISGIEEQFPATEYDTIEGLEDFEAWLEAEEWFYNLLRAEIVPHFNLHHLEDPKTYDFFLALEKILATGLTRRTALTEARERVKESEKEIRELANNYQKGG